MTSNYLPRIADECLQWQLKTSGAVQIEGPKWCGKTSTGEQCAKSTVFLQDPDTGPALLALADSKPSAILEGDKPRLIDEWQMAPQLWDAVRFSVDRSKQLGQYPHRLCNPKETPRPFRCRTYRTTAHAHHVSL